MESPNGIIFTGASAKTGVAYDDNINEIDNTITATNMFLEVLINTLLPHHIEQISE
jgi:hypothetical protein